MSRETMFNDSMLQCFKCPCAVYLLIIVVFDIESCLISFFCLCSLVCFCFWKIGRLVFRSFDDTMK